VVANFTANDTTIVAGGTVQFQNLSSGKISTYLWTFQGGTPPSSNLKTPPPVTYSVPGNYNVTLQVTGDFGTSTKVKTGYIHVGGIGINESAASSISVYPNPVKDVLNIESSMNIQEVQFVNLIGQVMKSQSTDARKVVVNTSDLSSGVYTLKIKINNVFVNKKIVVN
jgi:PKD repeat protein